jgi:hypothetical protein
MKRKVIEELISLILTIILLELIILKKISKLHFVHFIIVYISFYIYSNGIDFDDHGYYNLKYFFLILIFFLFLISLLNRLFSVKNKKIIALYILSSLIFFFSFRSIINNFTNCVDWAKGLNNTYLENDINKFGCSIQIPNHCYYKIGKYFLDQDRFSSCTKNIINERLIFLRVAKSPFTNKNTLHFGFPLTNREIKYFLDMDTVNFKNYIYDSFIDMNIYLPINKFLILF